MYVCLWVRARRARSRWEPPAHAAHALQVRSELRAPRCAALCRAESRGNHDQKCVSASGGVFSARACLLLRDGWRLSSRTVVMFVRFVSESFPARLFPSDPLGERPPEAPRLIRSGSFLKTQMQIQLGEVWFGPSPLC